MRGRLLERRQMKSESSRSRWNRIIRNWPDARCRPSSRGSLLLLVSRFSSSRSGIVNKTSIFSSSLFSLSFFFPCDDIRPNWKISHGDGVLSLFLARSRSPFILSKTKRKVARFKRISILKNIYKGWRHWWRCRVVTSSYLEGEAKD